MDRLHDEQVRRRDYKSANAAAERTATHDGRINTVCLRPDDGGSAYIARAVVSDGKRSGAAEERVEVAVVRRRCDFHIGLDDEIDGHHRRKTAARLDSLRSFRTSPLTPSPSYPEYAEESVDV